MTDDGKDYKYVYDAFGRLVAVKNQSNALVAEYTYNGLGYRTGWHYDVDGDLSVEANTQTNTDDLILQHGVCRDLSSNCQPCHFE